MIEIKQQIGTSGKIMLTLAYQKNDIVNWYVVEPIVPYPIGLNDWKSYECQVEFSQFRKLKKSYFYKHSSDLICKEVVKYVRT